MEIVFIDLVITDDSVGNCLEVKQEDHVFHM